jgi:hypothetical protein
MAMKSARAILLLTVLTGLSACNNLQDATINRYEQRLDSFQQQFVTQPDMPLNNKTMYDSLVNELEVSLNDLNQISGLDQEQQERVSLLGIRTRMVIANTLQEAVKESRRGLDSARQQLDSLNKELHSIKR